MIIHSANIDKNTQIIPNPITIFPEYSLFLNTMDIIPLKLWKSTEFGYKKVSCSSSPEAL